MKLETAVVAANASQSTEWYSEGESRTVEVNGVQITVHFVGRKGRCGRISITAPPGASFGSLDRQADGA